MPSHPFNDRNWMPDAYLSLDAPLCFEFPACEETPTKSILRFMTSPELAKRISPKVFAVSSNGSQITPIRIASQRIVEDSGLPREAVVLDTHKLSVFRLEIVFEDQPVLSRKLRFHFDAVDEDFFFNKSSVRLSFGTSAQDRTNLFPDSVTCTLTGSDRYRWMFRLLKRNAEKKIISLRFPDAAGNSPALLRINACDDGGKINNLIVNQAVDRDLTPMYCCHRSRKIMNPSSAVKSIYWRPSTRYFHCTLENLKPVSRTFFDFEMLRANLLDDRFTLERSRSNFDQLAIGLYDLAAESSAEDLMKLHD